MSTRHQAPNIQAFTEVCQHDQHCQCLSCDIVMKAGESRYYIVSSTQAAAKWVCRKCNDYYTEKARIELAATLRWLEANTHQNGSSSSRGQDHGINTNSIRNMVNLAQRKGSSHEQQMVQHLPPQALMGPPALMPRQRPSVALPPSWATGSNPSNPRSRRATGYSAAHAQHAAATAQWRSSAYAPGDRCQINMQVHYEIRPTKTINSRPVECLASYLSEGKSIPAIMTGMQIAALTMKDMFEKLINATTNGFQWDQTQMKVRDSQWNDLFTLEEEGHFGKFCLKQTGRDKKQIFSPPKNPFLALLVIDRAHYEAYEDFEAARELEEASDNAGISKNAQKGKGRARQVPSITDNHDFEPSVEHVDEIDVADIVEIPHALFTEPRASSQASRKKRPRSQSSANPSTPPKTKRVPVYVSPDRQRLQIAIKQAGSISNLSGLDKEMVEYSPISIPEFNELIESTSPLWICSPTLIRHGTLHNTTTQIGIGTFKTCHAGQLVLTGTPLEDSVLGANRNEEVVIKRFYLSANKEVLGGCREVTRYSPSDECDKTVMEANILCWASSLLQFGYSFIDNELQKVKEAANASRKTAALKKRINLLTILEPKIPRLRFVRGGIAKCLRNHDSIASSATRARQSTIPAVTYLLEEKIPASAGFTKYINNGSAIPLVANVDDPDYSTCLFLCCMQHILYVKSGQQLYISDFQGGGNLLTDPQVMTAANIGFGDGNVSSAFESFPSQHECNDYCNLFGLVALIVK